MFVNPTIAQISHYSLNAVNNICRLGIASVMNTCCYPILSRWIDHIEPRLQQLDVRRAFIRKVVVFSVGTLLLNLTQLRLLFGNRLGKVTYLAFTVLMTAIMALIYCLSKERVSPHRIHQSILPSTPALSPTIEVPSIPVPPLTRELNHQISSLNTNTPIPSDPFWDSVDPNTVDNLSDDLSLALLLSLDSTLSSPAVQTALSPSVSVTTLETSARASVVRSSSVPVHSESIYSSARFQLNGGQPLQLTVVPIVKDVKDGFLTEEEYQNLEGDLGCSRGTINYFLTGLGLKATPIGNSAIYRIIHAHSSSLIRFLTSFEEAISQEEKMRRYIENLLKILTRRYKAPAQNSSLLPLQGLMASSLEESNRDQLSRIFSDDCSMFFKSERYNNMFSEEQLIEFVNYFVKNPTYQETRIILSILFRIARLVQVHQKREIDTTYAQFASYVPDDDEFPVRIMNRIKLEFFQELPQESFENGLTLVELENIRDSILNKMGLSSQFSDTFINSLKRYS